MALKRDAGVDLDKMPKCSVLHRTHLQNPMRVASSDLPMDHIIMELTELHPNNTNKEDGLFPLSKDSTDGFSFRPDRSICNALIRVQTKLSQSTHYHRSFLPA
jgi:hypothetical protein